MKDLTPRQGQILQGYMAFNEENGRPPTLREMGALFDINTARGCSVHLDALEKKGRIKKDRYGCYRVVRDVLGTPVKLEFVADLYG